MHVDYFLGIKRWDRPPRPAWWLYGVELHAIRQEDLWELNWSVLFTLSFLISRFLLEKCKRTNKTKLVTVDNGGIIAFTLLPPHS